MMDIDDILHIFFDEADEHLSKLEDLFMQLNIDFPDDNIINAILRAAHSLKGNSATVGLESIAKVAHVMESLLDDVRKHTKVLNQNAVTVLLEAKDNITEQLKIYKSLDDVDPESIVGIVAKLEEAKRSLPRPGDVETDMIIMEPDTNSVHAVSIKTPHDSAKEKLNARLHNNDQVYQIMFILDINTFPVENVFHALQEFGSFKLIDKKIPKKQKIGNEDILFHVTLQTQASLEEIRETLIFVVENEDNLMINVSPGEEGVEFGLFDMVFDEITSNNENSIPVKDSQVDTLIIVSEFDELANEIANVIAPPEKIDNDPWGMNQFLDTTPNSAPVSAVFNNNSMLTNKQASSNKLTAGTTSVLDHPMAMLNTESKKILIPKNLTGKPDINIGLEIQGLPADSRMFQRAADRKEAAADAVSLRVNLNKVEQVVDQVGELVISQNQLMQVSEALDPIKDGLLIETLAQVAEQTKMLQESVLAIRMTPVNAVFNRFYRMVRELNSKLSKDVVMKIMGESTEIDKILAEKIVDPLSHLIRNAMDHGIENSDFREAIGKKRQGYILLRAFHRANTVVIEIMDDGAGLNKEKILQKAIDKGLLKKSPELMSETDIWNLIFEPGFSTVDTVSEVSGRGVGMDVVKQNIKDLNGKVEIFSAVGKGTKISLILPLTLSILDGMSFEASGQSFIMPVNNVVRTLVPEHKYIKNVKGFGSVIEFENEFVPVEKLSSIFELPESVTLYEKGVWLVLDTGDNRIVIWVDKLEGQSQVVLKSLDKNYKSIQGVFGATIKKDGSVALIVEAADIVEMTGDLRAKLWSYGKQKYE